MWYQVGTEPQSLGLKLKLKVSRVAPPCTHRHKHNHSYTYILILIHIYILGTYNIHTHTYLVDKLAYTYSYIGFMNLKHENIIFLQLLWVSLPTPEYI